MCHPFLDVGGVPSRISASHRVPIEGTCFHPRSLPQLVAEIPPDPLIDNEASHFNIDKTARVVKPTSPYTALQSPSSSLPENRPYRKFSSSTNRSPCRPSLLPASRHGARRLSKT